MSAPEAPSRRTLAPAALAAALVVAGFAALVAASRPYVWNSPAAGEPYNLVVEGFRQGHLWMAKAAPPALAAAPSPYAFATYRPYLGPPWNLSDLSYYRGHLYAYFGVTPAVLLFWPFRALTGGCLHQAFAVLVFGAAGYLIAVGLAMAAWRRHFPAAGPWAAAAAALLLGSVTTLPVFFARPGLFEVSISCGFMLTMAALAALWRACGEGGGRGAWIAAASLAYGLAVGSRPTLLFGAVILFLPAAAAFLSRATDGNGRPWADLLAALVPISAVGVCLALYNQGRFGNPLQFGHDYQLSGNDVYGKSSFGARFGWDNLRLYFLEPLRWHGSFPFVWEPRAPALAQGHLPIEFFFGVLPAFPVLAAAALAPRKCPYALLAVLFLAAALPICFYAGATSRYLVDFLPALALLAAAGFWRGAGEGPPPLRAALWCAWGFSVAVGWLLAAAICSFYRGADRGAALLAEGRLGEAASVYDGVCRINPDFRGQAELALGTAALARGLGAEGVGLLEAATRDDPGLGAAYYNLGMAYMAGGSFSKSADALARVVELDPADSGARAELGWALLGEGKWGEAREDELAALRMDPALPRAQAALAAIREHREGR